jgi:hypothetical protein
VTIGDSQTEEVQAVYTVFLTDLAGLDDYLNRSWFDALQQVATPGLVDAAQEAVDVIGQSQDHAVGTLRGDHESVTITGATTAAIVGCLDEKDWYLVSDTTGAPDPGVTRGYYVTIAKLLYQRGRWYVDIWQPTKGACQW